MVGEAEGGGGGGGGGVREGRRGGLGAEERERRDIRVRLRIGVRARVKIWGNLEGARVEEGRVCDADAAMAVGPGFEDYGCADGIGEHVGAGEADGYAPAIEIRDLHVKPEAGSREKERNNATVQDCN